MAGKEMLTVKTLKEEALATAKTEMSGMVEIKECKSTGENASSSSVAGNAEEKAGGHKYI